MLQKAYTTKYLVKEKIDVTDLLFLTIFISEDSFIYTIATKNQTEIIELGDYELTNSNALISEKLTTIQELILVNNLGTYKFEKVTILVLNSNFTLIPLAFANELDAKELLSFATGTTEIKTVLSHSINEIKFSFTVDLELINLIEKSFVNATIQHVGISNLSHFFTFPNLIKADLFLVIHAGMIEVCAKENTKLLVYNVFQYQSNEDILYYLLFLIEQFNFNPLTLKLVVAAELESNHPLLLSIKKYLKYVDLIISDSSLKLNGELKNLPQHYYFSLLNNHVCEL